MAKFKKIFLGLSIVVGLGLSVSSYAQTKKKSGFTDSSASSMSYDAQDYGSNSKKISVGFKRYTTISTIQAWAMHGAVDLGNSLSVGAGFGFGKDFDEIIFAGDVKKGLLQSGNTGLFAEGNAGFLKLAGNHFVLGARLGFDYALSEKLKLDFAYGLEFLFGNSQDNFGLTQSGDFMGSFGVHWTL